MHNLKSDNPILVCDVDGVVVDLSRQWWEWLCEQSPTDGPKPPSFEETKTFYDFHTPFKHLVEIDVAHYFWKRVSLYDEAEPVEGAVEFINTFKKSGFDIVFASHCEGQHSKSKWEFLKRNFPVDGFMATREKQYVKANIAIDDRLDHLVNRDDKETLLILKDTPHRQDPTLLERMERYLFIDKLSADSAEWIIKFWRKYYE